MSGAPIAVRAPRLSGQLRDHHFGIASRTSHGSRREVHGVRIEYEQRRQGYRRQAYAARRGKTGYRVEAASVGPTAQHFAQVVEVPQRARNVHFYPAHGELPPRYRDALQRIR